MSIEQKIHTIGIEKIKPIGIGDNVCLTFHDFKKEHSILTSPYSRSLFFVPLASKVDAGCVAAYVLCKDHKTKYLNELKCGDELLTMNSGGDISSAIIDRREIKAMPMFLITGKYRISGNEVFKLIDLNGEDYFNSYGEIFHLEQRKTKKQVSVLDINRYRNKKGDICAYLDVANITTVKNLSIKDKIMSYIQMPQATSRHFGIKYDGICLEK